MSPVRCSRGTFKKLKIGAFRPESFREAGYFTWNEEAAGADNKCQHADHSISIRILSPIQFFKDWVVQWQHTRC